MAAAEPSKETPEVTKVQIKDYLKDKKILIVDSSKSFSAVIQKTLIDMGAEYANCMVGSTYEKAEFFMTKEPEIIFSEYQVQSRYCLDFAPLQRKYREKQIDRVFVVITSNASDSAVAEAAEEEIDAYLLKPFSLGQLQETTKKVIATKIKPSEYMVKIQEAQDMLKENKVDMAEEMFMSATSMSNKPSLAWFYAGFTAELKLKDDSALNRYTEGRKINSIHYKCLQGQFNILFKKKMEKEAYEVIKILTDNFPVTPQLLSKIFTLSVLTKNIKDLNNYYELFVKLDRRTPELIKVVTAALITAGRLSILNKEVGNAVEFLKKAIITSGRDKAYIEKVIQILIDEKMFQEAEVFFKMWPPEDVGKPQHALTNFRIAKEILDQNQVIALCKQLMNDDIANEDVFKEAIRLYGVMGRENNAEDVIFKAQKKYPNLKDVFAGILKDALAAKK